MHIFWTCPLLATLQDQEIRRTSHFKEEARENFAKYAAFWTRGLVPWRWTCGLVQQQADLDDELYEGWGAFAPGTGPLALDGDPQMWHRRFRRL